jgi:cobalt/nickel transport system permease protein
MSLPVEHLIPAESWLSRADARWRLIAIGTAMVAISLIEHPIAAATVLAWAIVMVGLARVPFHWLRARLVLLGTMLVPFFLVMPFVVPSGEPLWESEYIAIRVGGLWTAWVFVARTLALVLLGLVLVATAPLALYTAALRTLGAPRTLVQILALTYRYTFVLLDELAQLRVALRVRGFRNRLSLSSLATIANVTGSLLVRGAARAERVHHAMRCRGDSCGFPTLHRFRTRTADVLAAVGIAAIPVVVVFMDRLLDWPMPQGNP